MSTQKFRKVAALALVTTVGLGLAACSSKSDSSSAGGKVTITVDCAPQKTDNNGKSLATWNANIAAFEKIHPNVEIKSISVGAQCDTPADFTARIQGGTEADVFYGYMTDTNQVLDADAAADITGYINDTTVPNWKSISDTAKAAFSDSGKVYAVPFFSYAMGLVYNKTLFAQAGLPTDKGPTTWDEVAADAKKIAALGNGIAGYQEYSAGNTGGWHFTAEVYGRGGDVVSTDGKSANVATTEGKAVLQQLKDMRFKDNSVGTKQLLGWADLLTNAAAGKVGMYIGAPDSIGQIVNLFKGKFSDWAMMPMPGTADGPAKATLGGGNGYFFKKGLSADQIKAGLEWVSYQDLTIGQGQYDYVQQNKDGLPVGLPTSTLFAPTSAIQAQADALAAANTNLNLADYANYVKNPVAVKTEPPHAQEIYAVLDGAMSAVLTQQNADIDGLLAKATTSINAILKGNGS
jgi:ABC-type glycerol-3-phosphate transport system substrate-binding protein